jgi:hypothetical protein
MPLTNTPSRTRSEATPSLELESSQTTESNHRQALRGMDYAEGSAYLAPVQLTPESESGTEPAPTYGATATAKLDAQMSDDDYELEDLCYMDTHNRMVTILRAYSESLSAVTEPDTEGKRAQEIARIKRMVGYLEYAQKIVPDIRNRNGDVSKADTLKAAFPELTPKEASKQAKKLYHIAATQHGSVRKAPGTFRGAGVGGALAKMGGAEIVYRDEIVAGKLTPGAPMQYWGSQSLWLSDGKEHELSGKEVYQAIVANRVDTEKNSWGIFGHSVTFVKYGDAGNSQIQCTDYGGGLNTYDVSDDSPYFIGANISTGGEATNAAEYVLQTTKFKADAGKDYIAKQAAKYNLDATKLATALLAGIAASGHTELATIQASASHHGTPTSFDHAMARLIGLWQYAVGTDVDGLFGNGSCTLLTGAGFKNAAAIKVGPALEEVTPATATPDTSGLSSSSP